VIAALLPGLVHLVPEAGQGPWQAPNLYLLGRDRLTLIDSGYDREPSLEAIAAATGGARLERIVLTHGHLDHAGGAWKLRERLGAEVWAHRAEEPAIARRFGRRRIDRFLEDGERIDAGGHILETVLTPGHAAGHLCLLLRQEAILLSGDLVTGDGSSLIVPPEGNLRDYLDSLRRVQALPLKTILPGHGPIVYEPAVRLRELYQHRELRELCIAGCLLRGGAMTLKDLTRAMYYGLIHPQLEGVAMGTAAAHLDKLIAEGSAAFEPADEPDVFKRAYRLRPAAAAEAERIVIGREPQPTKR